MNANAGRGKQTAVSGKQQAGVMVRTSHGFSGAILFQIPEGVSDLAQRVRPVDDRRDLAGLDEFSQEVQILLAGLRRERPQFGAHERRQQERSDPTISASQPTLARYFTTHQVCVRRFSIICAKVLGM